MHETPGEICVTSQEHELPQVSELLLEIFAVPVPLKCNPHRINGLTVRIEDKSECVPT